MQLCQHCIHLISCPHSTDIISDKQLVILKSNYVVVCQDIILTNLYPKDTVTSNYFS